MQCKCSYAVVAGGGENCIGYQLVVRDAPVRNVYLDKSIRRLL
jgi:hypothetical protein